MTWVGEEMQEQLLEGFIQGATPDYVDIHQFIEYLRARGLSPLVDPRLKGGLFEYLRARVVGDSLSCC